MASEPQKGEALARALEARGSAVSAEQAALLVDCLLSLAAKGLLLPLDETGPDLGQANASPRARRS